MKRGNTENLYWAVGMVNGIAYTLPEDKKEVKEALRAVAVVIDTVLHDEEQNNERKKADD